MAETCKCSCKNIMLGAAAAAAGGVVLYKLLSFYSTTKLDTAPKSTSTTKKHNNVAVVFIKPEGQTPQFKQLVEQTFVSNSMVITDQGEVTGTEIDKRGLIDQHYLTIARFAMQVSAKELTKSLGSEVLLGFEKRFGLSWEEAVTTGRVFNATELAKKRGVDTTAIAKAVEAGRASDPDGRMRLGPGCHLARIKSSNTPEEADCFVINGFYASMREHFTEASAKVSWYVVSWDPETLSWKAFRRDVLGATDPSAAVPGSMRRKLYDNPEMYGLTTKPGPGTNSIHASASPLEGLNETLIWTGVVEACGGNRAKALTATTGLGQQLLLLSQKTPGEGSPSSPQPDELLTALENPLVEGTPLFDLLEDLDAAACAEEARRLIPKI